MKSPTWPPCIQYIKIVILCHFQVCEPTGARYPVRREFYSGSTSPAGKGARWEWGATVVAGGGARGVDGGGAGGNVSPGGGGGSGEDGWHVYDMEVQEVRGTH